MHLALSSKLEVFGSLCRRLHSLPCSICSAMASEAMSPRTLSAASWFPCSDSAEKKARHVAASDTWLRESITSFVFCSGLLVSCKQKHES